jgi:hypothetical protein
MIPNAVAQDMNGRQQAAIASSILKGKNINSSSDCETFGGLCWCMYIARTTTEKIAQSAITMNPTTK